jgi:hypothetical protein
MDSLTMGWRKLFVVQKGIQADYGRIACQIFRGPKNKEGSKTSYGRTTYGKRSGLRTRIPVSRTISEQLQAFYRADANGF